MFAADPNSVRLIRTGKQREKLSYTADLEKIKRGEERDMVVQEGHVIEVTSSTSKLMLYRVYRVFTSLFRTFGATGQCACASLYPSWCRIAHPGE
jgi:hypothetical protein